MTAHAPASPTRAQVRPGTPAPGAPTAAPAPQPYAGVPVGGLTVGHAEDRAEHQADALADRALSRLRTTERADRAGGAGPAAGPAADAEAHRHTPGCGHLRRSSTAVRLPGAVVGAEGGDLDARTSGQIEAARGAGSPLSGPVRRRMETAFGQGLGHVRVHDGPQAARLNDSLSAQAFTVGNDIFLGRTVSGAASPAASGDTDGVLAHEIAHVVSEPAGGATAGGAAAGVQRLAVRRSFFSKLFGKKELTPDEEKAKQQEKDAKKAKKDQENEKKLAAKKSKKTEKLELARLQESRKEGVAGRKQLTSDIYLKDENGPDRSGERMDVINKQFEKALKAEADRFAELALSAGKGGTLPDEKAADQAYREVWYELFPELTSVRPPRETAAERLVIQVRQIRARGQAGQDALAKAVKEDTAKIELRMLGKEVEGVYDRMVVHRDDLLAKNPKMHPALAQDEAATTIRKGLDEKLADKMPPKDGPLDVVAWQQATDRVGARKRQAQRDRDTIETSLALLPPDERDRKKKELDATPVEPSKDEKSGLDKAQGVVGSIKKYGGMALTGIDTVGGGIAGQVGKPQDKKLREEQGVEKPKDPYGTVLPKKLDQGLSQAIHDGKQAQDWKAKGLVNGPTTPTLPESDATKAKTGIGQLVGVLNSLMSSVQSALSMARSIKTAWDTKDPYEGLKATKSGASALDGLVGGAKQTANLAKTIDSGVADGVKKVIPGFDIATAALAIVRGVMDVATTGMRQRETDVAMFEARSRSTDKVNVTVYPLMKVSQVYTKHLENSCWSLGSSIADLALSIAQVASGGGYGIPLAIKSAKTVLDNLHALGHFIADQVLAVMAQRAEKDSAVLHLEGGAEDELRRHPKMAVDGIIVAAAGGDETALKFLSRYRIGGKPITKEYVQQIKPNQVAPGATNPEDHEHTSQDELLFQIREAVFAGLDTSQDPKTVYDQFREGLGKVDEVKGTVTSKVNETRKTWNDTGELAKRRNEMAGKGQLGDNSKTDRGLAWRIRMFLSSEKRGKLSERTQAYGDFEPLPPGVACQVGDKALGRNASNSDVVAWGDALTVKELEDELARKPRRNSPAAIELIRSLLRDKTDKPTTASPPTWQPGVVPTGTP